MLLIIGDLINEKDYDCRDFEWSWKDYNFTWDYAGTYKEKSKGAAIQGWA